MFANPQLTRRQRRALRYAAQGRPLTPGQQRLVQQAETEGKVPFCEPVWNPKTGKYDLLCFYVKTENPMFPRGAGRMYAGPIDRSGAGQPPPPPPRAIPFVAIDQATMNAMGRPPVCPPGYYWAH